jgi:exosortase A
MTPAIRDWWKTLALIALVWTALFALLHPTGANMVAIWERSETYAHGYVVLPIALWLVWRKRHLLMSTQAAPDMRLLVFAVGAAGLWLVAKLMSVNVVEQYAFVGLLIVATWMLVGNQSARVMLFPLAYLLLMVPNGDNFMPQLMNFTADFTVWTLRLMGLPVYREGTYFSLPSGDWSVVEGCSGIRYIISSVTLGLLYAYLTYRTLWKRIAFSIAAFVVPILANGMRATLIVLIAHYSDMKLALGVDHFIYGWVWFGIVMLIMFAVGNIWREDTLAEEHQAPAPLPPKRAVVPAGVLVAVVALFPLYEGHLSNRAPLPSPLAQVAPPSGWNAAEAPVTEWVPNWEGLDDQRILQLARGEDQVMLFLGWYGAQRQGAELVNFDNQLVPQKHPVWRKPTEVGRVVEVGGHPLDLREAKVDSPINGQQMLVWYWNRAGGQDTTSAARIKLALGLRKLRGADDAGAVVIVAAPYKDVPEQARAVLKDFVAGLLPVMNPVLDSRGP